MVSHKEGWVSKNWYFRTVVLEKTLESPLDCKEIQPVHPKGDQPWIFTGRTNAEAEDPTLWPPDSKNRFFGKYPDAGKVWGQKEMGTTRGEMVGWHHWLNRHELEETLGNGEGQGSLACCSPWGRQESDMAEWPNNNNNMMRSSGSVFLQGKGAESSRYTSHPDPSSTQEWRAVIMFLDYDLLPLERLPCGGRMSDLNL